VKEFPKEGTNVQLQRKLYQHQVKLEDVIVNQKIYGRSHSKGV
jgi:hypothetical protein